MLLTSATPSDRQTRPISHRRPTRCSRPYSHLCLYRQAAVGPLLRHLPHEVDSPIMPTLLREGPYRFYFFSGDIGEPRHVHVDAGGSSAKFWLTPVSLHYNIGFSARELRAIERIVLQHQRKFMEAWDAYFGA